MGPERPRIDLGGEEITTLARVPPGVEPVPALREVTDTEIVVRGERTGHTDGCTNPRIVPIAPRLVQDAAPTRTGIPRIVHPKTLG